MTLLGLAVDPIAGESCNGQIVEMLTKSSGRLSDIIEATKPLAGRWVVIFQNEEGTFLLTDPCGFRQVFYYSHGRDVWCGSQPEIINAVQSLRWCLDEELLGFVMTPNQSVTESAWIGNRTIYENCFHLLPNHYLDLNRQRQIRFFPIGSIAPQESMQIIEKAAAILQGTMAAISRYKPVLLALTAGWDSRVLLAASKELSGNLQCCIDRMGVLSSESFDVWVPSCLAKKLGINFVVQNSNRELPGWFVTLLSNNVSCPRVLCKSRSIYSNYETSENRIRINGNGSEICRNFYDSYCDPSNVSIRDMSRVMGYDGDRFVMSELERWQDGLNWNTYGEIHILDLLYWEQRLGNWGAQFPAEQDIAIEEYSPFSCRLLIETLLCSPRQMRRAPEYPIYRQLIEYMWPEVLEVPINPPDKTRLVTVHYDSIKQFIKRYAPSPVIRKLRRIMKKADRKSNQ